MSDDGLRHNYFDLPGPSPADAQLFAAIASGHVPEGCLLGGHTVQTRIAMREDPCASCDGPRARCGGREKEKDLGGVLIERATNTSSEVRAEHRAVIRRGLDVLAADAVSEKGKG